MAPPALTAPFRIGDVEIANRLLLAPLAGIGNWFVRLQARRHGAGLAVSEMVSAIALERGNRRTHEEMLRIHPDEHPVSVQLFSPEAGSVRLAAAMAVEAGADIVDLNMGCPVRKVVKTGAGVALLQDPGRAVAIVRAAREGAQGRPVTVKLRSGMTPGDRAGFDLAVRLAEDAGAAAIAFHPRSANVRHAGSPDYGLAAELAERLDVPVILSGGLRDAARTRTAYAESGADAVMLARGALGNPWLFGELTGRRAGPPAPDEIVAELRWLIDRAEEHWGAVRAARNLRKLYPPYMEALGIRGRRADEFMRIATLPEVRERLLGAAERLPAAA